MSPYRCDKLCTNGKCKNCRFMSYSLLTPNNQSILNNKNPKSFDISFESSSPTSTKTGEIDEKDIPFSPSIKRSSSLYKKIPISLNSIFDIKQPNLSGLRQKNTSASFPIKSTKICQKCSKKLSGKVVRIPDSQKRYHWSCLKCKGCKGLFENTSFTVDSSKSVYHPQCSPFISLATNKSYNQHESNSKGRATDSSSPTIQVVPSFTLLIKSPTDSLNSSTSIFSKNMYNSPYRSRPNTPNCNLTYRKVAPKEDPVKPSLLMSSRDRPLPKFGVLRKCPGCGDRITSVRDELSGPNALKWHKKCLICTGCNKKLDSGATVQEDKVKLKVHPWCTTCQLSKRKEESPFITKVV